MITHSLIDDGGNPILIVSIYFKWLEIETDRQKIKLKLNIARIANLPYGQSQLYLKSAFSQNCEVWSKLINLVEIVKFG